MLASNLNIHRSSIPFFQGAKTVYRAHSPAFHERRILTRLDNHRLIWGHFSWRGGFSGNLYLRKSGSKYHAPFTLADVATRQLEINHGFNLVKDKGVFDLPQREFERSPVLGWGDIGWDLLAYGTFEVKNQGGSREPWMVAFLQMNESLGRRSFQRFNLFVGRAHDVQKPNDGIFFDVVRVQGEDRQWNDAHLLNQSIQVRDLKHLRGLKAYHYPFQDASLTRDSMGEWKLNTWGVVKIDLFP